MFRVLSLAVVWLSVAVARADFTPPALTGPVVDDARILSEGGRRAIASYLMGLREAGGTQITVLTVPTLDGAAIEEASIKVFDAWKLGGAKVDDGVLLLISAGERKMRIEVGRGREGELTDVTASRIIREVIAPRLRGGSADRAIAAGVRAIARQTDPQLADQIAADVGHGEYGPARRSPSLIHLVILLVLLVLFLRGGGGGFWGGFGGGMLGGGFGGGFGGGGSGGGWSGGGGGSAGGGASGDW